VSEQHKYEGSGRVGAVGLREDAPLGPEPLEDGGAPEYRGAIRVEAELEARRRCLGGEDAVVPREAKRRQKQVLKVVALLHGQHVGCVAEDLLEQP